mmetsp:Transcript_32821/g.53263  ORF Transcript_32821/g.53263 Transcript_32821/m.53263 type:complete len:476 (+) Transcript_32821:29-1456(+)
MGNNNATSSAVTSEQQNNIRDSVDDRLSKVRSIPVLLTRTEWLTKVKEQQVRYYKQFDDEKEELLDDYQLFIEYLIFRRSITGYSEICVIARIVRGFLGAVHGSSIFDHTAITFDGLRISIAVHPISAHIYIADEKRIYKLLSGDDTPYASGFTTVAEIPTKHQSTQKIKDVTFSADGTDMFCLMNDDLYNVYRVRLSDDHISVYERICFEAAHDSMDYLLYDFNHCYFEGTFFSNLTRVKYHSSHQYGAGVSYTLDPYTRNVWMICQSVSKSINDFMAEGRNINQYLKSPYLVRISADYITIIRKLQILNEELSSVSKHAMNDAGNDAYELRLQALEMQRNALREELKSRAKECAVISLHELIADEGKENQQKRILQVEAFDVDKLHTFAVYIITKSKMFVRIERQKTFDSADIKFLSQQSVNETKIWRTTHKLSLKGDVLPKKYPLGFCNVRYDSITGRILITDNYKMQALCM